VTSRQSRLRLRFPLGHCPVPSGLRGAEDRAIPNSATPYKLGGALNHWIAPLEVVPGIRRKGYCYACADAELFAIRGERGPKLPPETGRSPPQRQRHRLRNAYKILLATAIVAKSHPRGRTRTDHSGQCGLTSSLSSTVVPTPDSTGEGWGRLSPPQSFSRLLKTSEARRRHVIMSCEARRS
jgi:hypothetical protein